VTLDAPATDPRQSVLGEGLRVVGRGIRDEPGIFAVAVAGSALYGVGTAGSGWLLGRITARVLEPAFATGSVSLRTLLGAVGLLAAASLLTAIGVVLRRAAGGITMYRLQARYRRAVTGQYLRLPLAWHHRHPAGELLSIANADVEATWMVFAPLPMSLGVAIMLLVAGVAMVAADPVLGLIGLAVLPALIVANALYQRRMAPLVMSAQALRGDVSAVAHESFDGAQTVKTLGREASETIRFAVTANALRDANIAVGRMRGIFDPLIEGLPTLGTVAVLVVGSWRVSTGRAATADVVQVAYLLSLVSFPVRALGWVLGELPRTVVGWRRMSGVLNAGGAMGYGRHQLPARGEGARLRAADVHYAYQGVRPDGAEEQLPVLRGVTLDLVPGSTVAVVGPTGSGKSTLASVLVRLVDPGSGQVLLDGVDLRALRVGEVAGTAALVAQSAFLFDDTVRENVTLGAEVTEHELWRALRAAAVDEVVRELPHGLDTVLGERGATLSGGQRQRIALARALVRRPRLLVLDDATSAVDPRIEARILAGLRAPSDGDGPPAPRPTVIVIAYRMATITLADEVVYVEHGRIVGRGRHEELMGRVPGYRALVTAYARDAADRARVLADEGRR